MSDEKAVSALDVLAHRWRVAKHAEDAAKAERLSAEQALLECLKATDRTSGSDKINIGGGALTVRYSVTRKVEQELLAAIWPAMTEAERGLFRAKFEVDARELEAFGDLPQTIAACIETRAAKPAFSFKPASGE